MTQKQKQIYLLISTAVILTAVFLLLPRAERILLAARAYSKNSLSSYMYSYTAPRNLTALDTSTLPPAEAVPILMYHGVIVKGDIGPNTSRDNFIREMELLKEGGYETISLREYELAKEGKFILPAKPIIITFDDGRKDSFYTTDEVFKKLGFKATLFVATVKANNNDPFYLSWPELIKVQNTGRWDIQAHGRHSHDKIIIDENGTVGRYLTSRIYTPGIGLESVDDFKKRVEQDYINGKLDLKEHLGIDAKYFAVPLNNYGTSEKHNYPEAVALNNDMAHRYFKISLFEVGSFESFYNYTDADPYGLIRFEPQNINPNKFISSIEEFGPKPLALQFPITDKTTFLKNIQVLYGDIKTDTGITLLSNLEQNSSRLLIGDRGWKNYSVNMTVHHEKGRSVSVIVYYQNEFNFISLNWAENYFWFEQTVNGVDHQITEKILDTPFVNKNTKADITINILNGSLNASVNGKTLIKDIYIQLTRGAIGLSVWDPSEAQSTIEKLEIKSLSTMPQLANPDSKIPVDNTPKINNTVKIPYISDSFKNTEWTNIGDSVSVLQGSNLWKDYYIQTKIYWLGNDSLTLISRYQDINNYVGCTYSNYGSNVRMFEVSDGKVITLKENYGRPIATFSPWPFGMKVKSDSIECLIGNKSILTVNTDKTPNNGGIGLSFEGNNIRPNNATFKVQEVKVNPL